MRSLIAFALVVLVVLGAGCMKIHIDTVVEADGGGTATIELAMSREVADAVTRIGELEEGQRGGGRNPAAVGDLGRDRLAAACRDAGVQLLRHELRDDASGVRLTVTLGFSEVSDLSHALGALGSDAVARQGEELRITRTEEGHYLLANTPRPGALADSAAASEPSVSASEPPDGEALQPFSVLLEHVGELDIRRTITVPGEVISSNAREVEGRTSIWEINAANMLEEQDTGLDPRIVFRGDELTIPAGEEP